MTAFVLRRLAQLPLLLLAVYSITFVLAWVAPGNPFATEGRRPSAEAEAAMKARYKLDDPVGFYVDYLGKASGVSWLLGRSERPIDLGPSLRNRDWSVNQIVADGAPVSIAIGLAAILLAQRHFAAECARAGFAVRYLHTQGAMVDALRAFAAEHGPLRATEWAEREMRAEFEPLVATGQVRTQPHDGWMTAQEIGRAHV